MKTFLHHRNLSNLFLQGQPTRTKWSNIIIAGALKLSAIIIIQLNLRSIFLQQEIIMDELILSSFQILLFDNQNCCSKYSKMRISLLMLICCLLETIGQAKRTTSSNGTQINLFSQGELLPYTENISLFSNNDKIIDLALTNCCLLTLNNNNAIQVRNRTYVKAILTTNTNYFLSQNTVSNLRLIDLLFDEQTSSLVTVGKQNNSLMFSRFFLSQSFQLLLQSQFHFQNSSEWKQGLITNSAIYAYFVPINKNDYLLRLQFNGNVTQRMNFTTKKASIYFSPQKYALLVSKHSQIQVYDISDNIQLLFEYDGLAIKNSKIQTINFTPDGLTALIGTNDEPPIVSFNISSRNQASLPLQLEDINYVSSLDKINRFIMISKSNKAYFLDQSSNTTYSIQMEEQLGQFLIDVQSSRFFYFEGDKVKIIDYNVIINGSQIIGTNQQQIINKQQKINQENTTIYETAPTYNLYRVIYPSEYQNKTFQVISQFSSVIKDIAITINVIVFSSPFACFFLSFFNYFTLNSLYILLNVQIPNLVFQQFSSLFKSVNVNLLEYFNIHLPLTHLLREQVNEERALYFGITSSLVYNLYYQVIAFVFNAIVIETILKFRNKNGLIRKICSIGRRQMYLGIAISCIVPIILPWRFVILSNYEDFQTRANTITSIILYNGTFFFIISSLIFYQSQQSSKPRIKRCQTVSSQWVNLSEWYIIVQNFIYSFFVILSNPIFFLLLVLTSKMIEIYIQITFSKEKKWFKFLQILAYCCEIIFHLTFFIFWFISSEKIVIYSSIICMVAFWLGGFLNLIIVLITIAKGILRLIKKFRNNNKISGEIIKQQTKRDRNQTANYSSRIIKLE